MCAAPLVDMAGHVAESEIGRTLALAPGPVEGDEVGLGGVDDVTDHVPHLPVAGAGGRFPSIRIGRQLVHALGLTLPGLGQVGPRTRVHEMPLAHAIPPLCSTTTSDD